MSQPLPAAVGAFDGSTATGVLLGLTVARSLFRHAEEAAPSEACGILHGHYSEAGVAVVLGAGRLANVAVEPSHRYRFDESQQAAAWDAVRSMGQEVLGVWHSHPSGPTHPSTTDLETMQPWLLYPVLAPSGGGWALRVWRLSAEGYEEVLAAR